MALDSRMILEGIQPAIAAARPVTNFMEGQRAGQQLTQGNLQNNLLMQQAQQQAALAPLQQQVMEQKLAGGDLQNQRLQADLDALGVPDVPTAKEVALNVAKVAALPTTESRIAALQTMKQNAVNAGRGTENIDELLGAYSQSPELGDQLLDAGIQAFQQGGYLTSEEKQTIDREQLKIRQQELALKQQIEQRQQTKLSGPLENALLKSQDSVVEAQRASSEFDILADQVEDRSLSGGIQASTSETLKALLGTQDDVTELRRRFNKVRLSEGLKNLPPGPATDKDMEQAFKGVPPENAPASQIASFLRGAAKMARFDAGYNQFKSDFITDKSTAKGLNREWRSSVTSEVLGRDVTIAEIYAEAAASGLTPEEVKAELGIQ